jgi:hypothetical protein
MYRAIIASLPPRSPIAIKVLRRDLIEQFANSPLCNFVLVQRDETLLSDTVKRIASSKAQAFEDFGHLPVSDYPQLLVGLGPMSPDAIGGLSLTGFCHVGSIFQRCQSKDESILYSDLKRRNVGVRITSFRVGRVLPWFKMGDKGDPAFSQSKREQIEDTAFSIGSQFLPAKYREIESKDLALAIRLNYETCEPELNENGVEELNFEDCMKIIGLEDKI